MKQSIAWVAIGFFVLAWVFGLPALLAAADQHPFNLDDYSAIHHAHAVAVSPDGKSILYQVISDGTSGPVNKHDWHLIDISGENSRKLDLPEHFEPAGFTKDGGALFGIQPIDKLPQLAIVPLRRPQQQVAPTEILALPEGIHSATISPDGSRFALLGDPRERDPLAEVRTVVENDQTSLYVVAANGSGGGWWCPGLKNITDIAWSPDSSQIAVVTQWPKIGHHDVRAFVDICNPSGARRIAEVSNSTSGIAWAQGGQELVFASTTTPVLTPEHIWTVPVTAGPAIDRTPALIGTAVTVAGDSHGNVWVEMHKGVFSEIDNYRDGKLETSYRWPGGCVMGPPVYSPFASAAGAMAFNVADPDHADNVAIDRSGALQKITHEGDDTLASVNLGPEKVVRWTAKDGTPLEGIVTFPADYIAGKQYPFVSIPHGGPEANDEFRFEAFSRIVSGMGYVVMEPEYRGSTGYGSDFLAAIYQHFGDRAYSDVDSATDFAIAQGWADPKRLAMFGWSAGGFMTSWTVTQTHRYRAAIEGAGITDWLSFIPTSDIAQVDYDARLQEKDSTPLLQFSAVMHVDQVTTPLLILHGEADMRVPAFQGREYYVLLAERGKTVRMVTYPGSPHFPRLAEQRRDVFKEVRDWLKRYDP